MTIRLLILAVALTTAPLLAQTSIGVVIDPSQATSIVRIAIPFPELQPSTGAAPKVAPSPITPDLVANPFFGPLTRDIAYSGIFAIAPLPPGIPPTPELAKRAGANLLLKMNIWLEGPEYIIEARLLDTTGAVQLGQRYRSQAGALTRTAHLLASEIVRSLNGRPGIFMSQIAFASNRDGEWEIYLMDWDGANQRRITFHKALSILPSWSPDNDRLVYTSFARGTSDMYIVNRRGGGRFRIHSGLGLNVSATFAPIGNDIAFVGSVAGNPDIYLIRDDGSNLRRLTTTGSIESTPEWSPNGRQLSFTSGRGGTPQIYTMDVEGTNVQRISFDGDWNDDANWSPEGERIAFTSKVAGRFQIRIYNSVTGESRIVAGDGSNEQPTWSPDGQWISFQSNRSGKWQVYRMRADGSDLLQLTFDGENKGPDWSKKAD